MARSPSLLRSDAIPLYHQIFLTLRDQILSSERAQHSALPTEQALGAQFAVSRITARRALDELAAHGLVERRRRVGTRVTYRAAAGPIEAHVDQAVESLIAFGRDTQVHVVTMEECAADANVAAKLGLAPGAQVIRAVRIRSRDGEPLGAIESHVPAGAGVALSRECLTQAPLLELLRGAGHVIGGGRQTFSAVAADPALAALLATEPRAPIIRIERTVLATDGTVLLHTIAQYRGDRYRLSLDLQGAARADIG